MGNPALTAPLVLPGVTLKAPLFLPDGTRGGVRALDAMDVENCGVQILMMNAFHLAQRPGVRVVQALGGLKQMSSWRRPLATDSGGFQAYSLIRENAKNGSVDDRGLTFRNEGKKTQLTPEKAIVSQLRLGADLLFCLDQCTHVDDAPSIQEDSVRRTIDWGRRCKEEFETILGQKRTSPEARPRLFGVVQGGGNLPLRTRCAEALLEMGFDGFGFGGWPLDSDGALLTDILAHVRETIPASYPLHALGVGHPASIAAVHRLGYTMFDSALPTRDARHGRLYTFTGEQGTGEKGPGDSTRESDNSWFRFLYMTDKRHLRDAEPASPFCRGLCCERYSLGYLHHLFVSKDPSYQRLATIHNLHFMNELMRRLSSPEIQGGEGSALQ